MKTKNILAYVAAALLMVACSGTPDNGDDPVVPGGGGQEQPVDPSQDTYTLVADVAEIDANGEQKVTFSFLNGKGDDLCVSEPGMVKIKNETTGENFAYGVNTFTSVRNGRYTFSAKWRGYEASNTVEVKVCNRGKYEKYCQSVVVYKITGAWCNYCPTMTASLHEVEKEWGEQMIVVGCHGGNDGPDPFKLSPDVSALLLTQWNSLAYPSCVYDNNTFVSGAKYADNVKKNLLKQIVSYPATCGVKITEASLAGGKLSVKASLQSEGGGSYDLGCVLLEDGLTYDGGTEPSGVYDNVMRGLSGSFNYYNKATAVEVAAGAEVAKEFTIEGVKVANAANCRVVVFALVRSNNGQTITDNAAVCKVGGSMTDYVLNE
ncbi:MAG: Omp28-related outer membrane protein [Tidjanibacter sp.]|nr:Omp28-related outer membrane protein [Tidjanibacter sp.]